MYLLCHNLCYNYTLCPEFQNPVQKLWGLFRQIAACKVKLWSSLKFLAQQHLFFQRLIKGFLDSNLEMANNCSKMKGYVSVCFEWFFFWDKKMCLEDKFWNALEQQQNKELFKEIGILTLNFFLLVQRWCIKIWSTSKKEWCGAAPVWIFVSTTPYLPFLEESQINFGKN